MRLAFISLYVIFISPDPVSCGVAFSFGTKFPQQIAEQAPFCEGGASDRVFTPQPLLPYVRGGVAQATERLVAPLAQS